MNICGTTISTSVRALLDDPLLADEQVTSDGAHTISDIRHTCEFLPALNRHRSPALGLLC